jgi:hypothetical protein
MHEDQGDIRFSTGGTIIKQLQEKKRTTSTVAAAPCSVTLILETLLVEEY